MNFEQSLSAENNDILSTHISFYGFHLNAFANMAKIQKHTQQRKHAQSSA